MTPAELHGWWMVFVGPKTLIGCPIRRQLPRSMVHEQHEVTALDPVFEWFAQFGQQVDVIPTPKGPQKIARPVLNIEAIPVGFIRGIERVYLPDQVAFVRIDELGPVERDLISKKITELQDAVSQAEKIAEQSRLVQP